MDFSFLDHSETLMIAGLLFMFASFIDFQSNKYAIKVHEYEKRICRTFGFLVFYMGVSSSSIIEFNLWNIIVWIIIFIVAYIVFFFLPVFDKKFGKKFEIVIVFASIILIFCSMNLMHHHYGQVPIINENDTHIENNNNNDNNIYKYCNATCSSSEINIVKKMSNVVKTENGILEYWYLIISGIIIPVIFGIFQMLRDRKKMNK